MQEDESSNQPHLEKEGSEDSIFEQDTNPVHELIEAWPALNYAEKKEKFNNLSRTDAEEFFLSLKASDQSELVHELSAIEKRSWVRMLAPDDAADLIQELGVDNRNEILSLLDSGTRREVRALLAYADDVAGGIMTSRYFQLHGEMSVDEAISYLRIQSRSQVETIYYAYVIHKDKTLIGVVSFKELFVAHAEKLVKDIMSTDIKVVPVDMDQEDIAKLFSQYDLMALPVVDEQGKMQGIVTFDDVAQIAESEATEDFQKLGGVEALDAPYFQISLFDMIKKRVSWLILLFVSEMFTANAMANFQNEIEKAVVLALFIPLIISSGGNSGSQASTLIIRAMALGEVRMKDWWRVLVRELGTTSIIGFILGFVGYMRILLWPNHAAIYGQHYNLVGLTVGVSVVGVVIWGSITGAMLPFLLRIFKLDPATASAPFVATLVDVTGLIIYFTAASFFLKGFIL